MKMKKFYRVLSVLMILSVAVTFAFAQEKSTSAIDESTKNADGTYSSSKYDEAQRPEDSYLAKFHAIDVVGKLMKKNLDQIYLLKVIVTNFSDKGWKGDYDKVYTGYKRGMELYYKRNIIYSRVEFETNKKDIDDLLKKILVEYKKETQSMLNECADKILLLHLDATTHSDPNKSEELYTNQLRLQIAYGQFDDALSAEVDHYNDGAIYHYRVAKTYAIKILEELSKPEERDSLSDKLKVHKADNLNRIYEPAKGQKSQAAEESK
ncbi:MAG TPA: hypothetical protein PK926_11435 [Spirochaetota bacterium]|nr:hypothetical protein [Spirochaetota bacterium]HPI89112.1 hypothetical protein [Spirochaetota bacterium]HPR48866.1 hypothetical protein [Spirochaetota bacterium]